MAGHRRPVTSLIIPLALALLGLVAANLASAHPYHLMGGNADTSVGFGVETSSGKPLAQSFRVFQPFTLTRVALNISDIGTSDVLWVGIVADAGGVAEGSILAQTSNDSGPGFAWINYNLDRAVNLTPGTPYWIVANSSEQSNRGYAWWNSGYNANATGTAAYKQGSNWVARADDFAFLLYGWGEVVVTLDHRAAAATGLAGAETSFFLDVNVTGTDPAYNVSLGYWYPAANLSFRGDSSAGSGLALNRSESPGHLRYLTAKADPGRYGFTITFLVDRSVVAGTVETTNASLSYWDFLGRTGTVANVSASVRVLNLALSVAGSVDASAADPGALITFWLAYATDSLSSTTVSEFQASLILPPKVAFQNASGNSFYDSASRAVSWAVGDLLPGKSGTLTANVLVDIGLPPRLLLRAFLTASYADSPMTRATLLTTFPTVVVRAPLLSVELVPDRGSVRSNETATYTIYLNNSGNGFAGDLWINDTLDARLRFLGAAGPRADLIVVDRVVRWHSTDLPPGAAIVKLTVVTSSVFGDGDMIENAVNWAYTDRLGHFRDAGQSNPTALRVRAPRVTVDFSVDKTNVSSGAGFSETMLVRNVGSEPAFFVFVNQSLESFTRFVRDSNPLPPIINGRVYSWPIPVLQSGQEVNLTVALQSVNDGGTDALVGLFVVGSYTDASGRDSAQFRSQTQVLAIRGSPTFFSLSNPWFLALLAVGSILGAAGAIERAFGRFVIEEIFLVRRDGILIVHRSRNPTTEKDVEVFAAMLTVVQDFIRDTFGYRPGRQLRQLSFGNLSGFIAPGSTTSLAVMYQGRMGPVVRRILTHLVLDIESKRGPILEAWEGSESQIADIAATLDTLVRAPAGILLGLFPPHLPRRRREPPSPSSKTEGGL